MKALLAGYGEVGQAVFRLVAPYHQVVVADPGKEHPLKKCPDKKDLILVAFPWSEKFKQAVRAYRDMAKTDKVLVFSTVPIGTCRVLGASHFPVEGKHPKIDEDVKANPDNVLGGPDPLIEQFLRECGLKFTVLEKPDWTEFLKLRSLAYYGLCIEFARTSKEVADEIGLPWDDVMAYDRGYNWINARRGTPQYRRPVLLPPEGKIGGHCVLSGIRMLYCQTWDGLLKTILYRNGVRRFKEDPERQEPKVRRGQI